MNYYTKERHNPQSSKIRFVAMGQRSAKDATKIENPSYGTNYIHKFTIKKAYEVELERLNIT